MRRHPLVLWITRTASAGLFFVPLARDLSTWVELHTELSADRRTIAEMGTRQPLASALATLLARTDPDLPPASVAISPLTVIDHRIDQLTAMRRVPFLAACSTWRSTLLVLLLLLALLHTAGELPLSLTVLGCLGLFLNLVLGRTLSVRS
jgi:hypothetical protein